MKHFFVIFVCVILASIKLAAVSYGEPVNGESISPYFWVEGGESSLENFPLKDTNVDVFITGVIAAVTVRQVYSNMGAVPINGKYIFPGSTRAAVHGMKMTIGNRVIRAKIKEKKEARKTFEKAKKQGKNASLLEQKRPNLFSMEVANIMPGDTIEVELKYTELLVPENGTYEFVYPTVVGPRYTSLTTAEASSDELWVQNPYLKVGTSQRTEFNLSASLAAGMPIQEINCTTHDINVDFKDKSQAGIELSKQDGFGGNRDFILQYRLSGKQISSGLILQQGEDENFFLLMAQPPKRVEQKSVPAREYLFVIDVSGSMEGYPLDTAKLLLKDLLGGLLPIDTFNVMLFAGGSEVMSKSPVPATPAQIEQAIEMIENSRGGGGTELLKAMNRAMALPKQEGVSRTMVVVTDGYVQAEHDVFEVIQQNLEHTNVFTFGIGSSVNRYLVEGMAKSGQGEPFIVTMAGEAKSAAQKFVQYISSPVLTDIEVNFDGLDVYDIEPPSVPDLFADRPVIVLGKWRGNHSGTVSISGKNGEGVFRKEFTVENMLDSKSTSGALNYLWARSRISRISDYSTSQKNSRGKEDIISLGLKYNLLTSFTSFVAVDEIVRNPNQNSKDVKQPLTLPKNVSNSAVGGGMKSVPEPGILILAAMLLLSMAPSLFRRIRDRR
jgi:Ca-activated chloride channel family protein